LRAGLAEAAIGVREGAEVVKVLRWRGNGGGPARTTIGEDGSGVALAVRTVAGGFAAAAAEGVEGGGEERFTAEEGFEEIVELLLGGAELCPQGAEVVGHRVVSGA
jgi:hypothetical protein